MDSLESLLNEIEAGNYENPGEATALLAEAVTQINTEFTRANDPTTSIESAPVDRLRKWVAKLWDAARAVAHDNKARGFAVTIGLPAGVSVTIEWDT